MRALACLSLAIGVAGPAAGAPATAHRELRVERTVWLMRHGVRAPLTDPAMRPGIAAQPWRKWPVPRAHLTAHGYAAVRQVGRFDRARSGRADTAPCPKAGTVLIVADNDQRTIATGQAWAEGFAPGCSIEQRALPPGAVDPVFAPLEASVALDAQAATLALQRALPAGGLATLDRDLRRQFRRLDAILCGPAAAPDCGVIHRPTALRAPRAGREPALTGALADAATAAQILTLEYAEGMSMPGWGRVTSRDLRELGRLRAALYRATLRTPQLARALGGPTLRRMAEALDARRNDLQLTLLIGHDSNIAAVAGLLDLHWQARGFAADDPPVSGAIGLQLLSDRKGKPFVRAVFRSPSLDQIRSGASLDASAFMVLPLPACTPTPLACPADRFAQLIAERTAS